MTYRPDIVLHHSPCDDGFGAAWAVNQRWPTGVDYHGVNYGLPLPDLDYVGKNVLVVDFSFDPTPDIKDRRWRGARSLVFIDHHKTAEAMLRRFNALPGILMFDPDHDPTRLAKDYPLFIWAHFDIAHSGAWLTHHWVSGGQSPPKLIEYLEDRDLWKNELSNGRAFTLYLRSFDMTFQRMTYIADRLENSPAFFQEALAIERFYDRQIEAIVASATKTSIGGYDVPLAYVPKMMASDVGHALLDAHGAAPFTACVCVDGHKRLWSLRSDNRRQDVSEIAKKYGGGGHRNAAGFSTPL